MSEAPDVDLTADDALAEARLTAIGLYAFVAALVAARNGWPQGWGLMGVALVVMTRWTWRTVWARALDPAR